MFWLEKVKNQMIDDKKIDTAYDFQLPSESGLRYLICSTLRKEEYLQHDRSKHRSGRPGFSRKPLYARLCSGGHF